MRVPGTSTKLRRGSFTWFISYLVTGTLFVCARYDIISSTYIDCGNTTHHQGGTQRALANKSHGRGH